MSLVGFWAGSLGRKPTPGRRSAGPVSPPLGQEPETSPHPLRPLT